MAADDEDVFEHRAADIRKRVAQQGFMRFIGAELDELAPGACVISIRRRPAAWAASTKATFSSVGMKGPMG